jgi:hypothetical protein
MSAKKDLLELATSSPDPAVRALAIRRHKLDQEIEVLDGFFNLYGEESQSHAPSTAALIAPDESRREVFLAAVKNILREASDPLPLATFYEVFQQQHPEIKISTKEYFRQKLYDVRDTISLLPGQGYYLPNEA